MKFTTQRSLRAATLALGAAPIGRYRLLVAFAAALAIGLTTQVARAAMAADGAGLPQDLRVGHTVKTIYVPGSFCSRNPTSPDCDKGENRPVAVQLWYPVDVKKFADWPKTVYRSALYGLNDDKPGNPPNPLIPGSIDRPGATPTPSSACA